MSAARFEIHVYDHTGIALDVIVNYAKLDYALATNEIGGLTLTLPGSYTGFKYLQPDAQLVIWRTPDGGVPQVEGETAWLIRTITRSIDDGIPGIQVEAVTANELLTRRVIPYLEGSAGATKSGAADDLMKTIVTENFGATATDWTGTLDANRNWSSFLTVEPNATVCPTVARNIAFKNVFDVLKDLAQASRTAGIPLYFDLPMVGTAPTAFLFRTYPYQRGNNHSYTSTSNIVMFGPEYGNIVKAEREWDYTREITSVYVGGPGELAARNVLYVGDTARQARSRYGRREQWVDARNATTSGTTGTGATISAGAVNTTAMTAAGNAALADGRPRKRFWADMRDTVDQTRGLFWNFGDVVSVVIDLGDYAEVQDYRIEALRVSVDGNGEQNSIRLSSESDL